MKKWVNQGGMKEDVETRERDAGTSGGKVLSHLHWQVGGALSSTRVSNIHFVAEYPRA